MINLSVNTGYVWSRLSFVISEYLLLDDDRFRFTQGLESERRTFLKNTLIPQVRYTLSRRSSITLGYTNDMVVDFEEKQILAISHRIAPGFQYRFSRVVSGDIGYSLNYVDRQREGEDTLFHTVEASLGWVLSTRARLLFNSHMLLEKELRTAQLSAGVHWTLSPEWSLFASAGSLYIPRTTQGNGNEDEGQDFFATWRGSLSGDIARQTILTFTISRSIDNTSGDVADRGLVLRSAAEVSLRYIFTLNLNSTVSIEYGRNESLEEMSSDNTSESSENDFITAGLRGSYAFTSTILLLLNYEYDRQFSSDDEGNFQAHQVMLALSAKF